MLTRFPPAFYAMAHLLLLLAPARSCTPHFFLTLCFPFTASLPQAQLALEVYSTMKSRKIPILQDKFARVIFYSLMKTCQNQILYQWAPQFDGKPTPWKGMQTPVVGQRTEGQGQGLAATIQGNKAWHVLVACMKRQSQEW